MLLGVVFYLVVHYLPWGTGKLEGGYLSFCGIVQPVCICMMLVLQMNLISPKDLKLHRWHFKLLGIQAAIALVSAVLVTLVPNPVAALLLESVFLCFVCPTAAAAGVITTKLGGNLSGVMTYTVLANTMASVLIPLLVPFQHPTADLGFIQLFWIVLRRVFSLLLLPLAAAWLIRLFLPKVQKWLEKFAPLAFYIWGFSLLFSISLATASLFGSGIGVLPLFAIGIVSLACCIAQFYLGRRTARRYGYAESVTAGQAMGQKNTGFIIWLGVNYLTPVTSIAGGLYAIWHNLVNSWELQRQEGK